MSKYNFNIDIENDNLISLSKSSFNSKSLKVLYEESLNVVDLSLPSRTLWCKYNLGVDPNKLSKPEDWYGDYYAWGEITPNKPEDNWKPYKYNKEDHLTELQLIDDAAYLNMHLYNLKFKMPSKELFEELIEETNNEWVENFNNSGVNGYKFTNKSDSSKYIFLPAAGYVANFSGGYSSLNDVNKCGVYWSSSLDVTAYEVFPARAWSIYFNDRGVEMYSDYRYTNSSIRPVIKLK